MGLLKPWNVFSSGVAYVVISVGLLCLYLIWHLEVCPALHVLPLPVHSRRLHSHVIWLKIYNGVRSGFHQCAAQRSRASRHQLTALHPLVVQGFGDEGFDLADGVDHRLVLQHLTVRVLHSVRLQGQVVQLFCAHSGFVHHYCDSIVHDHGIQPDNTSIWQLHPIHVLSMAGQ